MKLEDRVVRLSLPPTESIRANYERSRSILVAQTDRLLLVDVTSILPSGGSKNVPHHRYHMYVRSVLDDNEGSPAYFAAVFKRVLVEKGRYSTRIGIAKLVSSIDYPCHESHAHSMQTQKHTRSQDGAAHETYLGLKQGLYLRYKEVLDPNQPRHYSLSPRAVRSHPRSSATSMIHENHRNPCDTSSQPVPTEPIAAGPVRTAESIDTLSSCSMSLLSPITLQIASSVVTAFTSATEAEVSGDSSHGNLKAMIDQFERKQIIDTYTTKQGLLDSYFNHAGSRLYAQAAPLLAVIAACKINPCLGLVCDALDRTGEEEAVLTLLMGNPGLEGFTSCGAGGRGRGRETQGGAEGG